MAQVTATVSSGTMESDGNSLDGVAGTTDALTAN